jgi:hypothetical protein
MRIIKVVIAILVFPLSGFATTQVGDILIWEGDTLSLRPLPLELREDYGSLIAKVLDEIQREYKEIYNKDKVISLTSCVRGYLAEWILLNDSIFLNNIYHCNNRKVKVDLKNIFPDIEENDKIFASWINGNLYLQQGKDISFRGLFNPIYEFETGLSVENGVLKNFEFFHNRIEKRSAFLDSTVVYDFQDKNINWDILPDLTNKTILILLLVNINEHGQIESITRLNTSGLTEGETRKKVNRYVPDIDVEEVFINETIRIAGLIPEWDVIYQRGKIREEVFYIYFSEEMRTKYKK